MDATIDPYSTIHSVLEKFPTEENAKNAMEQREMESQRIHTVTENIVEQLNNLKPSYNEQMNMNAIEKKCLLETLFALERDTERRRLFLKEKEIELEGLQQLYEIRRGTVEEQRKQIQSLKDFEAENNERLLRGDIPDDQ